MFQKKQKKNTGFPLLIEKLKAGENTSWNNLDFILRRVSFKWMLKKGIPMDYADELYQETLLLFFEKFKGCKFESFSKLKSYFFSIADNKSKEFFRARNKKILESGPILETCSDYSYFIVKSDEEKYVQQVSLVKSIIETLPNKEKNLLILLFKKGKSLKEAAESMNITEGYARVIKLRALNKVRNKLSKIL